MKNLKINRLLIVFICIAAFLLSACKYIPEGATVYQMDNRDTKKLIENTPERLARESSELYKKISKDEISGKDAIVQMMQWACEEAHNQLAIMQDDAASNIDDYKKTIKEEGYGPIEEVYFSKVEYTENDTKAVIFRTQEHKNGHIYYFRQDFIKEDNVWRIAGDNPVDQFFWK
jgi:hypothetical protein